MRPSTRGAVETGRQMKEQWLRPVTSQSDGHRLSPKQRETQNITPQTLVHTLFSCQWWRHKDTPQKEKRTHTNKSFPYNATVQKTTTRWGRTEKVGFPQPKEWVVPQRKTRNVTWQQHLPSTANMTKPRPSPGKEKHIKCASPLGPTRWKRARTPGRWRKPNWRTGRNVSKLSQETIFPARFQRNDWCKLIQNSHKKKSCVKQLQYWRENKTS